MAYFDVSGAAYNEMLRILETTDPAHANTFNPLFRQLINNDVALKEAFSELFLTKNKQAEFLLNLHRTGKKYGVHFDDFSISPSPIGTRLHDAVGMEAVPSTDNVRGRNDFEGESVFYHLEVNGYVDEDGEFVVEYIKDLDSEFSRTERDVWCLYLPQWISITIDANGENKILSDIKFDGSFPEGGAIRPDGTIRPFVAMAKYQDSSDNSTGVPNSVSGAVPSWNNSHNSVLTKARKKGNQYCATSFQDVERMNNLFDVAFATRDSQSVMKGTISNYYLQYPATVSETSVEHIVIAKAQANNLIVGSCVSIGNATALNAAGTAGNIDRGQAGVHSKANRVKIVSIEDYDDNNKIITVDNGGTTFDTAPIYIDNVECPTYITTMPWFTGSTDSVLGSCGSPRSNTDGKNPYVLFGVEMILGQYEVCGNAVMRIEDHVMHPYVVYDCKKASSSAPTSDYAKVRYAIANTEATWKYISKLGFDADHPMCRHGIEVEATSTTGYADAMYTEKLAETNDVSREILLFGYLNNGADYGRRYAGLGGSLGGAHWGCGLRLSASGRCAQAAA